MHLKDIPVVYICPDHNEKYHARKEHTEALLRTIGFTSITHHKSGTEAYPACLATATIDILKQHLDDMPVLILEDDVDMYCPLNEDTVIEFPPLTDAFYLGMSKHAGHPTENSHLGNAKVDRIGPAYLRILNMLSTHAIVYVSRRYKEAVIQALTTVPAGTHTDVAISRLQPHHFVFSLRHPLLYQSGSLGNDPRVEFATKFEVPDADTTVVTAFYAFKKSKHSIDKYLDWIGNFFQACASPVVCFTDDASLELLRSRVKTVGTTIVNTMPFRGWRIVRDIQWENQVVIDPERAIHGPELYGVWALKQEAVMEAIAQNPFRTQTFVWCDIGCFRDMSVFPSTPRFATIPPHMKSSYGWFAALSIADLLRNEVYDRRSRTMLQHVQRIQTIGGGVLAGDIRGWTAFSSAYLGELRRMLERYEFCGKDQLVYRRILLSPSNAMSGIKTTVVPARNEYFGRKVDEWFTLTYLFSGL
jgi:hypothetical protein